MNIGNIFESTLTYGTGATLLAFGVVGVVQDLRREYAEFRRVAAVLEIEPRKLCAILHIAGDHGIHPQAMIKSIAMMKGSLAHRNASQNWYQLIFGKDDSTHLMQTDRQLFEVVRRIDTCANVLQATGSHPAITRSMLVQSVFGLDVGQLDLLQIAREGWGRAMDTAPKLYWLPRHWRLL